MLLSGVQYLFFFLLFLSAKFILLFPFLLYFLLHYFLELLLLSLLILPCSNSYFLCFVPSLPMLCELFSLCLGTSGVIVLNSPSLILHFNSSFWQLSLIISSLVFRSCHLQHLHPSTFYYLLSCTTSCTAYLSFGESDLSLGTFFMHCFSCCSASLLFQRLHLPTLCKVLMFSKTLISIHTFLSTYHYIFCLLFEVIVQNENTGADGHSWFLYSLQTRFHYPQKEHPSVFWNGIAFYLKLEMLFDRGEKTVTTQTSYPFLKSIACDLLQSLVVQMWLFV